MRKIFRLRSKLFTGRINDMVQNRKGLGDIIQALTVTVLFVVILSLVVFGAKGYQHAVEVQDANGNMRAVISYIANSVRDSGTGQVSIEERSGTNCLIIGGGEDYEQRFYLNDGVLLEEYTGVNDENRPEVAVKIGKTGTFDCVMSDDGLLEITTDEGTAYVNTKRH